MWDKHGLNVTKGFYKIYGFTPEIKKNLNKYIDEWYGDEMRKILDKIFFSSKIHKVDDCGSYNFTFKINEYIVHEDTIIINCLVDNGTLQLIFSEDPDKIWKFNEMFDNPETEDFLWEVQSEISDCIYELFYDEIKSLFGKGVDVGFEFNF